MLVLTRKAGEKIVIGQNIEVTVVEIDGNRVRLAFDAPPEISIHRQEVADRLKAEAARRPLVMNRIPAAVFADYV